MTATVTPHGDLDALLDGFLADIPTRPESPRLFPVVIPSAGFADWLRLRIAERRGVAMGIEFITAQTLIARVVGDDEERQAWDPLRATWHLLAQMDTVAAELGVSAPLSRERFALAMELAARFDQYAHFRPEMVLQWAAARRADAAPDAGAWQGDAWRALRAALGHPHPVEVLARRRRDAGFLEEVRARLPRLSVLGTGSLDPMLVRTIALLREAGTEVRVHVVLPSFGYLGELRRTGHLPRPDAHPEDFETPAGHPLLAAMGRQAVGAFLLLGEIDEDYSGWPESPPSVREDESLLARIQSDVRALRAPRAGFAPRADASLRVHACFGPRRELETLRDEILRAFRDLPDLRPEHVHIATPDYETYAPLVEAILDSGDHRLPVRLAELPASQRPPVTEGLLALLAMADAGKAPASELLELLHLRAVRSALGVDDGDAGVDAIREWIIQSGLTHGVSDEEARQPGSWTFARDRLVAGRWFGPAEDAAYPSGEDVLPVAGSVPGDAVLLDRFLAWHAILEETLREWRAPAPAAGWAERLRRAAFALLAGGADDFSWQRAVNVLEQISASDGVDAGSLHDWLGRMVGESRGRSLVSGRMTFGRLKQLQHLPCRVLAIVGMQDATFPSRNRAPGWDLLQQSPRVWDRSPRSEDRQLFLDAVLTPTDRLIITASALNVRNRQTEPFSSCVDELLGVAAVMGAARADLVTEHRLQPYAPTYFGAEGHDVAAFDEDRLRVARRFADERASVSAPFWDGASLSDGTGPPETLTVRDLVQFWKNPAAAFVRAAGLVLPGEEPEDTALDEAPLILNGLGRWKVKDAALASALGGGSAAMNRRAMRLRADRLLPPGRLGDAAWESALALAGRLAARVRPLIGETRWVEVRATEVTVAGALTFTRDGSALLAWRVGKYSHAEHLLAPWIAAVTANAAGLEARTIIFDDEHIAEPLEVEPLPAPTAAVCLDALVRGWREGRTRPLAFAPETSRALAAEAARDGNDISAARREWERSGEINDAAGQLAWRDRDPFADEEDWRRWAGAISGAMEEWRPK